MLKFLSAIAVIGAGFTSPCAYADDEVDIPDTSKLTWVATTGDRVYLRNLSTFASPNDGWLGCCYNYYIDTSTEAGRVMFSALLTSYAARLPLSIFVANKTVAGPVTFLGRP